MAKIIPTSLVQSISGKTCRHDNTYFATNGHTGSTYAVRLCHPYEGEASELQVARRGSFKSKSALASQWWNENKPSTASANGTAAYQALRKAFKSQYRYGNIYAFMRTLMDDEGTVTIGSTAYPLSGGNDTPGGGSGSGGSEVEG